MKHTNDVHLSPDVPIPDQPFFKIGEASHLVGVEAHVLRYWERELPGIKPSKTSSNQRRYRRKDVELFREVRRLLRDEKFTLAGVKKQLASGGKQATILSLRNRTVATPSHVSSDNIRKIRNKVEELIQFCTSS